MRRKKKSSKFCTKMPLVLTGQEFWPECTVGVFEWKLVDGIYRGPRKKWKILYKEKSFN